MTTEDIKEHLQNYDLTNIKRTSKKKIDGIVHRTFSTNIGDIIVISDEDDEDIDRIEMADRKYNFSFVNAEYDCDETMFVIFVSDRMGSDDLRFTGYLKDVLEVVGVEDDIMENTFEGQFTDEYSTVDSIRTYLVSLGWSEIPQGEI